METTQEKECPECSTRIASHTEGPEMMTEIQTIEGGPKRCLLTRGDQIKRKNSNQFN